MAEESRRMGARTRRRRRRDVDGRMSRDEMPGSRRAGNLNNNSTPSSLCLQPRAPFDCLTIALTIRLAAQQRRRQRRQLNRCRVEGRHRTRERSEKRWQGKRQSINTGGYQRRETRGEITATHKPLTFCLSVCLSVTLHLCQ